LSSFVRRFGVPGAVASRFRGRGVKVIKVIMF
jgi:hypothetical protein